MWVFFTCVVNLMCAIVAVAVPTQNDVVKSFQTAVHQQDLQSILISIEERLRNLDDIYSMHISTTFEQKLDQYQRKLEAIDSKIIRLESLVMLNLDKISENISTKNFKDDISKTNLVKKIDGVYEGLTHRMNYLERKFDAGTGKILGKMEATISKIEKMDEAMTSRNEEIEIELSDAIAAIDDLKSGYNLMEENIVNNTNENFEISLKEQMLLMKGFNEKSNKAIQTLYENTTKGFGRLEQRIGLGLEAINETDRFLGSLKHELKRELNEYAVKVAEMNSENWKTGNLLKDKQTLLEIVLNSTQSEVQNGMRALMVLISKITNKDHLQSERNDMQQLHKKIDSNFEKVFTAQSLFMDSCYRLQMDESQIESKISDILEKLIATFEKKTTVELKDIKNLERLIKMHDTHVSTDLYQANTNVITIYEKIGKDHKKFENDLKQVSAHLNALFSLIQDTLADEKGSLSSKNVNLLLADLKEMEEKITALYKQGDVLTNSVAEIKRIGEDLKRENTSEIIDEYFRNISKVVSGMEAKINTVYLYYYFNKTKIDAVNQNITTQLREVLDVIEPKPQTQTHSTNTTEQERIDGIIREIFGTNTNNQTEGSESSPSKDCAPNLMGIIDVRFGADCKTENSVNSGTGNIEQITETSTTVTEYEDY